MDFPEDSRTLSFLGFYENDQLIGWVEAVYSLENKRLDLNHIFIEEEFRRETVVYPLITHLMRYFSENHSDSQSAITAIEGFGWKNLLLNGSSTRLDVRVGRGLAVGPVQKAGKMRVPSKRLGLKRSQNRPLRLSLGFLGVADFIFLSKFCVIVVSWRASGLSVPSFSYLLLVTLVSYLSVAGIDSLNASTVLTKIISLISPVFGRKTDGCWPTEAQTEAPSQGGRS